MESRATQLKQINEAVSRMLCQVDSLRELQDAVAGLHLFVGEVLMRTYSGVVFTLSQQTHQCQAI